MPFLVMMKCFLKMYHKQALSTVCNINLKENDFYNHTGKHVNIDEEYLQTRPGPRQLSWLDICNSTYLLTNLIILVNK